MLEIKVGAVEPENALGSWGKNQDDKQKRKASEKEATNGDRETVTASSKSRGEAGSDENDVASELGTLPIYLKKRIMARSLTITSSS